jgi:hypothetical protein
VEFARRIRQQTPFVVVVAEGQADRYVVIDGYKRIAALEKLGRDTVEAVVWPMSDAAAVLLDRSLLVRAPDSGALAQAEIAEWSRRSLERRLRLSGIKRFKPMADFEWSWPAKIEREVSASHIGGLSGLLVMELLQPGKRQGDSRA